MISYIRYFQQQINVTSFISLMYLIFSTRLDYDKNLHSLFNILSTNDFAHRSYGKIFSAFTSPTLYWRWKVFRAGLLLCHYVHLLTLRY